VNRPGGDDDQQDNQANADGRNQNVSRKDAKAQRDVLVFYRENTPPSP
jgi:hypothetical protein